MTKIKLLLACLFCLAVFVLYPQSSKASDHFLCYKAKLTGGNICAVDAQSNAGGACETEEECGGTEDETAFCIPNKFPKGVQVSLTDQFEDKDFNVKKPVNLCAPADKNGEGITDPLTHLKSYQIKEVAKSCTAGSNANRVCTTEEGCGGTTGTTTFCQATPKHVKQTDIKVRNQFHPAGNELVVDTIKPDRLLVPTAKDLNNPVDPPENNAHNVDHYKCYTVKVTPGTPKFVPIPGVSVDDQFTAAAKLFDLKKPTRLCTPVDKNGEGIKNAASHLMCYQAKLAPGQPKHVKVVGIHVNNQFGPEQVDTVKEEELCVPSEKNPTTCDAGFANCNGNAADGCEIDISGDENNCGACGTVCSDVNGTASCATGACQITCDADFADCNGNATDGCETDISSDSNCGACGNVCTGGATCQSGVCVAPPACGLRECTTPTGSFLTDTCTDPDNCGACFTSCFSTCSAGVCQ